MTIKGQFINLLNILGFSARYVIKKKLYPKNLKEIGNDWILVVMILTVHIIIVLGIGEMWFKCILELLQGTGVSK